MLSQLKEIPAYKVGSYIFRRLLQHKVIHVLYKGTAPISEASIRLAQN